MNGIREIRGWFFCSRWLLCLQMLDRDIARAIGAESFPARFVELRRNPIDKLVNGTETAGEIETAMAVGNQDIGTERIYFRGNDCDRDRTVGFTAVQYFMRDKCFLLQYPQQTIDRVSALPVLRENQNLFFAAIGALHNLEQLTVLLALPRVMKYAVIHSLCPHSPQKSENELEAESDASQHLL
jgi:hypothetical protein